MAKTGRPSMVESAKRVENRLKVVELIEKDLDEYVYNAKLCAKGVTFVSDKQNKYITDIILQNVQDPEKLKSILDTLKEFFRIKPDLNAIIYLIDRAAGKPTEIQEIEAIVEEKGIKIDI